MTGICRCLQRREWKGKYRGSECLRQGLLFISSGYYYNRLGFLPPFVISREELSRGVEILDRVLTLAEEKFEIKRPVSVRAGVFA